MLRRFWWVFLVILPAGAMVGFLVASVVTYVMPKKYESETIIEVKASHPLPEGVSPRPTGCGVEFDKIKSRASLAKVVERLEFTNRWGVGQEAAIRILRGIVITENIRGTDLIAIRVRHTDRKDARDIAAELARIYQIYRLEILYRDLDYGLAELNKAVKEQEEKVEERRKVLSDIEIARKKNITVDDTETLLHLPGTQDYIDVKRDFETDQALLQTLRLKQIRSTVAAEIPNDSIVIHKEPQIANSPVSPNVTLNLILGAAGGFLLSSLLALPVMLLLKRLNPRKEGGSSVHPG